MPLRRLLPFSCLLLTILIGTGAALAADGAEKPQGPPPMLVALEPIGSGAAQPMVQLVGTVRYVRTSRVAGETAGIVDRVYFTEGGRVAVDSPLLQLNTDLMQASIAATRAAHDQTLIELERARRDLRRIEVLFREESVAEVVYDENHYRVLGLEKQAEGIKATLDGQLLEQAKATVHAPFNGLIVEKNVEAGEWVPAGGQVALIADDSEVEVVVNVPENLLAYLKKGQVVSLQSGPHRFTGRFSHFIPQGDVATRTFAVKLRLTNTAGLIEGMEARALLPSGEKVEGLLVSRDAILRQDGNDILFIAVDGQAKLVPVEILGYQGMQFAIAGPGLEAGQQVVVKGNERIRDGQAIRVQ